MNLLKLAIDSNLSAISTHFAGIFIQLFVFIEHQSQMSKRNTTIENSSRSIKPYYLKRKSTTSVTKLKLNKSVSTSIEMNQLDEKKIEFMK